MMKVGFFAAASVAIIVARLGVQSYRRRAYRGAFALLHELEN